MVGSRSYHRGFFCLYNLDNNRKFLALLLKSVFVKRIKSVPWSRGVRDCVESLICRRVDKGKAEAVKGKRAIIP